MPATLNNLEDCLTDLAQANGWTVPEITQLRWELWGREDLPDGYRQTLQKPSTIREGVQMLLAEGYDRDAVRYLSNPPRREGSQDGTSRPVRSIR